jgi:hypothetical protein
LPDPADPQFPKYSIGAGASTAGLTTNPGDRQFLLSGAGISISPLRYRRAMDEQQQPTIRITLDDSVAQGEYINFANIIHSPSEFVIDLGRIVPGQTDVKIYSRVIMTPLHAKQLLEALAQNISIFEQKFGEIRADGASVFSSNEPSN